MIAFWSLETNSCAKKFRSLIYCLNWLNVTGIMFKVLYWETKRLRLTFFWSFFMVMLRTYIRYHLKVFSYLYAAKLHLCRAVLPRIYRGGTNFSTSPCTNMMRRCENAVSICESSEEIRQNRGKWDNTSRRYCAHCNTLTLITVQLICRESSTETYMLLCR